MKLLHSAYHFTVLFYSTLFVRKLHLKLEDKDNLGGTFLLIYFPEMKKTSPEVRLYVNQ